MFQLPSIEVIARSRARELERARLEAMDNRGLKGVERSAHMLGFHVDVRVILQPRFSVAVRTSRAVQ